ncbi:hypothetical protein CEXT_781451 [Caerostris extrusa]|uniref:Secreted protein n=1 Tax=Caerostris extrusa TaxID=172846 RepID=A0AAV4XQ06_CAEEX|nr:hypothetical protein CEXT_781451 [Caerostris extrusa]
MRPWPRWEPLVECLLIRAQQKGKSATLFRTFCVFISGRDDANDPREITLTRPVSRRYAYLPTLLRCSFLDSVFLLDGITTT